MAKKQKEKSKLSPLIQVPLVSLDKGAMSSENKCTFCTGSICCTYMTQEIDTPRSKMDYSNLLWQVSHEHVNIYKDEDGWNLLVEGKCSHLQLDGGCGIYESRPLACREHSNDHCEFDAPADEGFELYFSTYEALLAHCRKKFKSWGGRKTSKQSSKSKGSKTPNGKGA
jgi:Fe-S-cluster containining protein